MVEPLRLQGARWRAELGCDYHQVRIVAEATSKFLSENGCGPQEVTACEIALVEACNNAIQYAEPQNRDLPIKIEIACTATEIEMTITDHTPGMVWQEARPPGPEKESGRGIFLMQALMDRTTYSCGPAGNTLVLAMTRDQA